MKNVLRFAAVLALSAIALSASTVPITYMTSMIGSGTLDGTAFTNATVTLTGLSDTSLVTYQNGYYGAPVLTISLMVSGIAPDAFTNLTAFGIPNTNPSSETFGFYVNGGFGVLEVFTYALATYDMRSGVGPVSGYASAGSGPFTTVRGSFRLDSVSTVSGSFAAFVQPTPEPSALATRGAGAIVLLRRRRKD